MNALLKKCKFCFDVSICMKWINLFWTSFVIMNFADISKKGNKCHDHKVSAKNDKTNVSMFLIMRFSKELVVVVGNVSILTNTHFHLWTIWIKGLGAPWGTFFFWKPNEHSDYTCSATGHVILDLEIFFSNSLEIKQQKMMSFCRIW